MVLGRSVTVCLVIYAFIRPVTASEGDTLTHPGQVPSPAYLVREQEVTRLFDEYETKLDLMYEYLAEPIREIDLGLYRDIQAAQVAAEKSGYQVIPEIVRSDHQAPERGKPKPNHFNWPICEGAINEELNKLADITDQMTRQGLVQERDWSDFMVEKAKQFIELKKTWRKIQRWINYNRVWQGKVASGKYDRWYRDRTKMIDRLGRRYDLQQLLTIPSDPLFFDRARVLTALDPDKSRRQLETIVRREIKSIGYAVWVRTRFTALPDYVKLTESARQTLFTVPLYTDIQDEQFLSRFVEIVEANWQATIDDHQFQVDVDLQRISPKDLYGSDYPPQSGERIDENDHAGRFPEGAALTTGGRTTHSIGGVVLLGPKEISETTLAHEFGHALAFSDRYFRGYADLSDDGYDLFEVGTNPDDIMSHPGSGAVLPRHFKEMMDAVRGANLTAEQYVNLSQEYYRQREFEKSIKDSQRALALDPANAAAYNNICVSNIGLGNYDAAVSACEQAILLNPSGQLSRNNLAWAKNEKRSSSTMP